MADAVFDNSDGPTGELSHQQLGVVVRHITASQSELYAYVCSLLGTVSGAADVLQEANIVLWEKAAEYDPGRPFMPWAYKIAFFQVLAHRKRNSRDRHVFDDALLGQIADTLAHRSDEADPQLSALDGCVGKLPPKQRTIIDARYSKGEAVEDIARRAGKPSNAVAAELYRIRKALMECIRNALLAENPS